MPHHRPGSPGAIRLCGNFSADAHTECRLKSRGAVPNRSRALSSSAIASASMIEPETSANATAIAAVDRISFRPNLQVLGFFGERCRQSPR
jgi:hypothetical protein